MKRGIVFLFVVGIVLSCRVGPQYRRPPVAADALTWKDQTVGDSSYTKYKVQNPVSQKDSFKLDMQWWEVFGDPVLNELIQNAFNNSPSLKTAAYRIMEARGLVNSARANFYPSLSLDPSITSNRLSGERPSQVGTKSLPVLTLTTISVPLDMSYEFDVWGKFRRGVESAKASMLATAADHQVVKLGLASDIASNYFNLRLFDNQIQLFSDALKLRTENLKLTTSQYEAGITTRLDVVQAEIEAATVEAQVIESRRNRALSENAIAVLCGIPAMSLKIEPRSELPAVPAVPLEVPSDLLERRPDIVEAEQQVVSANAQIGVAQAAFLPSVRLTSASLGYLSSQFNNLFIPASVTWLGGIGISIPIFTGGRNIAQRDVAVARLKESETTYQQVVLSAFREVQDAMANIEYRTQQSEVQQRALKAARETSDMSKELYKKGLTTYINVIVADRSVLDAENTLITVTAQRLLYTITLIKALGGGWKAQDLNQH